MVEDVDRVRVGTTGTIGSLMYRELESMRRMEQINGGTRRAARNAAVSISCGRPLASLAGYRLNARKQSSQDSNARPSFFEGSNVEAGRRSTSGKNGPRGFFDTPTCRAKLAFGRQESLPKQMDYNYKPLPRKSVSLSEEDNVTPGSRRNDRGGEFRTPMLRKDGDVEEGGCRKSMERRGVGICSLVEVVDLSCNGTDKIWGSPIASRLRRLSFSRLSESVN